MLKITNRFRSALAVAMIIGLSTFAGAATVPTWTIGSGQYQDNFLVTSDPTFTGGAIELGLRAVNRTSLERAALDGDTYSVHNGYQTAGQNGASVTATNRAVWNFDIHVDYAGGINNLDSLTLAITSPAGNTVSAPLFNLFLIPDDNPSPNLFQQSQNPVFAPWFSGGFDMNVVGTYTFTLTAMSGADTVSESMNVAVVPLPTAATAGFLGLSGLAFHRRRNKTAA